MKRSLIRILIISCLILTLTACTKNEEPDEDKTVQEEDTDRSVDKKKDKKKKKTEYEQEGESAASVDITSEKAVMSFISGEWKLVDTLNDKEYATLKIDENGTCTYTREFDGVTLEGTFKISRHETYDHEKDKLVKDDEYTGFELSFSGMDPVTQIDIPQMNIYPCDEETTSGVFNIACNHLFDYMSLEWIGNGDSYIFETVFQDAERLYDEYDKMNLVRVQDNWVFRRLCSGKSENEPIKNGEFYGLIWNKETKKDEEKNKYDLYWIQDEQPHTSKTLEDYTNRWFMGGYFSPSDIKLAGYRFSEDVNTYLLLNEKKLESSYPSLMCKFTTDSDGNIIDISEVDKSFYGVYDLGDADQEFSYDGLTFTINGMDYEITDYAAMANAIMDMYAVGDWIVVETHINPHTGAYILYNTLSADVEKTILGANLTWINDDITTAVYSNYSDVYNFKDHLIGMSEGEEIYDIKYDPDGSQITVKDMYDKTFTFETDISDTPMYAFADYMRSGKASDWERFVSQAPYGAVAYVMINPPEDVAGYLPEPYVVDNGNSGMVAVVKLTDGSVVYLYEGTYNVNTYEFEKGEWIDTHGTKEKGNVITYDMVVPEGMPSRCISISGIDNSTATFPVATLSGRSDICGEFIVPD